MKKVSCDYCDKAVREVLILEEVGWFADVATSKKGERKKVENDPRRVQRFSIACVQVIVSALWRL